MSCATLFYHKVQNQFNSYLQKSEENLSKRERAKHLHGASPCLHNSYWTFPTSDLCLKTVLSKPTEMQRNTKIITSTTKTTSIHKLQLFQLIHSQQQRALVYTDTLLHLYNCSSGQRLELEAEFDNKSFKKRKSQLYLSLLCHQSRKRQLCCHFQISSYKNVIFCQKSLSWRNWKIIEY